MIRKIFIALALSIAMLFLISQTLVLATEGSSEYYPVNYDDDITFTMTDNHDGTVTASWSKYAHAQDFTFYKLIRSQINYDPVYPEDGYIFYSDNINTLTYTDTEIPSGKSYYRICHIAEQYRYCSKIVLEVNTAGSQDDTEIETGEDTEYQYDESSGDDLSNSSDDSTTDDSNDSSDDSSSSDDSNPTPPARKTFSDLPSTHWASSCVEKLAERGVVSGNPDGTFKPDRNVNRAEFTKMLILAFYPDLKDYADKSCFNDVSSTDWFAPYVCAAKSEEIVEGYGGNVFYPANNMTRAEAVAALVKALNLPVSESVYEIFSDVTAIWQIMYVNTAHKYGLVDGYSDNTFHPEEIIARSEAAQLICNALDRDFSEYIEDEIYDADLSDDDSSSDSNTDNTDEDTSYTSEDTSGDTSTQNPPERTNAIIINHANTDISRVPAEYIEDAKDMFNIAYGHTSHGSQITTGMEVLRNSNSSLYAFSDDGSSGLYYNEDLIYGDLGSNGATAWAEDTRDLLDANSGINMVMWSWCGGVSDTNSTGIATYLNTMNALESEYPDVTFVYMTGHLDGTGETGNLHLRNEQIRNYAISNDKVLYDFADIESFDPNSHYFVDLGATDGNDYNDWSQNWADEWCAANAGSTLCVANSCAHSTSLNCNLKGRAFWWMMARLAGWDGV